MLYTSDLLLASIKTRAMIPNSQNTFQDSDLINLANEEMETFIIAALVRVQEEYNVVTDSIPINLNQQRYRMPDRAMGQKLRDVYITIGTSRYIIPRISREALPLIDPLSVIQTAGFYVEGNYLVLVWLPNITGASLEVSYHMRPGVIVDSSQYELVTSIDTSTNTLGMALVLPTFLVGSQIDVQTAKSGSEYNVVGATIQSIDTVANTITLDKDVSLVALGDYICVAKQCAVPQCPEEMHPMLAQRVVCRVLESLNDKNGLEQASQKLQEMEKNILSIIDNRVEGRPLKIVNRAGILSSATLSNLRFNR